MTVHIVSTITANYFHDMNFITVGVIGAISFSLLSISSIFAQQVFTGTIIDACTKEPVAGASVQCSANCSRGCATDLKGAFKIVPHDNCCDSLRVSCVGYQSLTVALNSTRVAINLQQDNSPLRAVVVTASREAVKRSEAPVAISIITAKTIQDAKPVSIDQLLNKVSGVYMVNLGNEQHSMSIRQPMTTKSMFLYLEDGIPIRTTGLFNHNALLEMNMAAVKSIEVIKGPSSALYGSEAVGGVVNFSTIGATALPVLKFSMQKNNVGYQRADLQASTSIGRWGFAAGGYYADKRSSFIQYTDFHKGSFTARIDYRFSEKTLFTNSITVVDYYSDMTGGIDSTLFFNKSFESNHTFTYRKVFALRYRFTLTHHWTETSKTNVSLITRHNSVGQNPAYAIKDDFRRVNGIWMGSKDVAHGEINEVKFNSYAFIAQHKQGFNWKNALLIGGVSMDISPSQYSAEYIHVNKDSTTNVYGGYQKVDSFLTHYKNDINNYAAYTSIEFSPANKLRVVASLRYDFFRYDFNNFLRPSSYSGSPDTLNNFRRISPKVGLIYNISPSTGIYANYSEGFVPPQVTEMYKGVKVPELKPSVFYNYEIGGWIELFKDKVNADVSIYRLEGTNEIISVKLDDGSSQNMNAGKTLHKGVEFGLNARPLKNVSLRISGALSKHQFKTFVEKGISYNGNKMNGAPQWMHNAEIWWRPAIVNGLRIGIEWQKIGSYYMDPMNTAEYEGYNVYHARAGYKWRAMEFWINVINVADKYYAYTSSKSSFGYSYTPAEPRNFCVGLSYDFGSFFKNDRK